MAVEHIASECGCVSTRGLKLIKHPSVPPSVSGPATCDTNSTANTGVAVERKGMKG